MERKSKTIVLWIIENENGEILMTERIDPKIKAAHKKRDVPGWTHEIWETLEETVIREIQEETWLIVSVVEGISQKYSKTREHEEYIQDTLLYCYICKIESWIIQTTDHKIGEIRRVHKDVVLDLDMLETTLFFLVLYTNMKK